MVVTTLVSILSVYLNTIRTVLSSVSECPSKPPTLVWLHLTGDSPFFTFHSGSLHDAVQLIVLFIQFFFAVCSSHFHSFAFIVVCWDTECYTSVPCVVQTVYIIHTSYNGVLTLGSADARPVVQLFCSRPIRLPCSCQCVSVVLTCIPPLYVPHVLHSSLTTCSRRRRWWERMWQTLMYWKQ